MYSIHAPFARQGDRPCSVRFRFPWVALVGILMIVVGALAGGALRSVTTEKDAEENDAAAKPKDHGHPHRHELSHNLGNILYSPGDNDADGLKLRHTFSIHNPGPETMQLKLQGTSCGCTRPIIENERIEPGETGSVELVTEPARQTARVHEYANLGTGIEGQPPIRISLSANVLMQLEMERAPVEAIRVRPGATKETVFNVIGRQRVDESEKTFTLEIDSSADGLFDARIEPREARTVKDEYRIACADVIISIMCPEDVTGISESRWRGNLRVRFGQSWIKAPVEWRPDLDIRPVPERVFVRRTKTKVTSTVLRLEGKQPFSITELEMPETKICAEVELNRRSDSHEITIAPVGQYNGPSVAAHRLEVAVRTDLPNQEIIRIPVMLLDTP